MLRTHCVNQGKSVFREVTTESCIWHGPRLLDLSQTEPENEISLSKLTLLVRMTFLSHTFALDGPHRFITL